MSPSTLLRACVSMLGLACANLTFAADAVPTGFVLWRNTGNRTTPVRAEGQPRCLHRS